MCRTAVSASQASSVILWGVQGYTYFLIFAPKHRLLVLVRSASGENIKKNSTENFHFLQLKKISVLYIAWASFPPVIYNY